MGEFFHILIYFLLATSSMTCPVIPIFFPYLIIHFETWFPLNNYGIFQKGEGENLMKRPIKSKIYD